MTPKLWFKLCLLLLLTGGAVRVSAQLAARMDSLLRAHQAAGFNGNVLFSRHDSVLYTGNFGYEDYATKASLTDASVFELASCSKQFTALGILQLIERGKLDSTTLLTDIFPELPYPDVTVVHLLRHQSGLPDYMDFMGRKKRWDYTRTATNDDVIRLFAEHRPAAEFAPGERYEYSNTGYLLLASILERVSGQSFADYLREHIFEPAGMSSSLVYRRRYDADRTAKPDHLTHGYSRRKPKKPLQPAYEVKGQEYYVWLDGIVGDGMVNSTILDLEKYKRALRENRLISAETKAQMFAPDAVSTDYGYGVELRTTKNGRLVMHSGSWAGYYTVLVYRPALNEFAVVLTNNEYADFGAVLVGMLGIASEERPDDNL